MSDHRGVWGAREDAVWWPGAIAADQQSFHHQQLLHQQQLAVQQQQQAAAAAAQQQQNDIANSAAATQQLFSYKMASTFQHPATTMPNVSSPSSIGTTGMRGYDYRLGGGMTGGNPAMTGPSPAPQWWYPSAMDSSMQNSLANTPLQSNMQNMSPVQTPPPVTQQSQIQTSVQQQQAESQVRQQQQQQQAAEVHRQQEAHRQQVEAQAARQQAEAQAARQQAVAEAQARHQSQQNQLQQQQNQLQQQQNHQQHQQNHQVQTQAQQTQTLHQPVQQNHQSIQHHQPAEHQQSAEQQKLIQPQITTVQVPTRGRMPRGKADARPRGRMTAYAFFVQTCREEHKKKHPEENVVFAEFSKKCAERWKTMLDKEKKRFHEMAEKDKKRYDAEMQNYTPPKGEKQRGKKRKQIKDPNAPKRSLSAFFWFCNDERSKVKSQNPEFGVGDIAKELGRRWAEADSEVKSKYEAMAEKDKARYEKEMTAYKKKNNPSMPAAPVPDAEEEDDEEEEIEEDEDE